MRDATAFVAAVQQAGGRTPTVLADIPWPGAGLLSGKATHDHAMTNLINPVLNLDPQLGSAPTDYFCRLSPYDSIAGHCLLARYFADFIVRLWSSAIFNRFFGMPSW